MSPSPLQWAMEYSRHGYSVFPCKSNKTPYTEHGVKDATTDPDAIRAMWQQFPKANIGVAAGRSGILIVDYDKRNDPGGVSIGELREILNGNVVEVVTTSGGRHFWYKAPEGLELKPSAGKIMPGVDIRAGESYVLAPGSGLNARYRVIHGRLGDLPKPPKKLIDLIDNAEKARAIVSDDGTDITENRNVTLTSFAGLWRRVGMEQAEIEDGLIKVNARRCKPPLEEAEVLSIAKSVQNYPPKVPETAELIDLHKVTAKSIEWLWEPYIAIGKVTVLAGPGGIGKSNITLAIASCLSTGGFLPGGASVMGKTLICTVEDNLEDTVVPRLMSLGANMEHIKALGMIKRKSGRHDVTLSQDGSAVLEETVRQLKPRMVVIDTITAYMGPSIDMHRANQVRSIMKRLGDLASRQHCAVVAITHTNKSRDAEGANKVMGSADFVNHARSVLLVEKDPEDYKVRIIKQVKTNLSPPGPNQAYEIDRGKFYWRGERYEEVTF